MKTVITLDKYDIQKIIAQHFHVLEDQVTVQPYIGISGYGMAETECAYVRAEVTGDIGAMTFGNEHFADNYN